MDSYLTWFLVTWPDERITLACARDLLALCDKLSQFGDTALCRFDEIDPESIVLTFKPKIPATSEKEEDFVKQSMPTSGVSTLSAIEELWETGKMSDVTLCTERASYKAHKLILSAACPYFEKMFCSGMRESSSDTVTLTGFSPLILDTILKFIYTGNVKVGASQIQEEYREVSLEGACDPDLAPPEVVCDLDLVPSEVAREAEPQLAGREVSVEGEGSPEQDELPVLHHSSNVDVLCECTRDCMENTRNTRVSFLFWRDLYHASKYYQLEQLREYCVAYLACICRQFTCVCVDRRCPCSLADSFRMCRITYELGREHGEVVLKQCAAELIRKEMSKHIWISPDQQTWKQLYFQLPEDLRAMIAKRQTEVKHLNIAPFVKEEQFDFTMILYKWKDGASQGLLDQMKSCLNKSGKHDAIDGEFLDSINALHVLAKGVYVPEHVQPWTDAMHVLTTAGAHLYRQDERGDTIFHILSTKLDNPLSVGGAGSTMTMFAMFRFVDNRGRRLCDMPGMHLENEIEFRLPMELAWLKEEEVPASPEPACDYKYQRESLERIRQDISEAFLSRWADKGRTLVPIQFELCETSEEDSSDLFERMAETLYPRFQSEVSIGREGARTPEDWSRLIFSDVTKDALCRDIMECREGIVYLESDPSKERVKTRSLSYNLPQRYSGIHIESV